MTTEELACWNCGQSLQDVPRPISRHEQCPQCFEALHCCRLCRHYRAGITGQCDEDRADPPVVKENANFCDWFRPSRHAFAGTRVEKSDAARDKLATLFGNDSADAAEGLEDAPDAAAAEAPRSKEDEARDRLNDLFSKDC